MALTDRFPFLSFDGNYKALAPFQSCGLLAASVVNSGCVLSRQLVGLVRSRAGLGGLAALGPSLWTALRC